MIPPIQFTKCRIPQKNHRFQNNITTKNSQTPRKIPHPLQPYQKDTELPKKPKQSASQRHF